MFLQMKEMLIGLNFWNYNKLDNIKVIWYLILSFNVLFLVYFLYPIKINYKSYYYKISALCIRKLRFNVFLHTVISDERAFLKYSKAFEKSL